MNSKFGKLFLIPTTLGQNEPLEVLPISVKKAVEDIDFFIVENEKSARRFIKKIVPRKSQPALRLFVLDKYTSEFESKSYIDPDGGLEYGLQRTHRDLVRQYDSDRIPCADAGHTGV